MGSTEDQKNKELRESKTNRFIHLHTYIYACKHGVHMSPMHTLLLCRGKIDSFRSKQACTLSPSSNITSVSFSNHTLHTAACKAILPHKHMALCEPDNCTARAVAHAKQSCMWSM